MTCAAQQIGDQMMCACGLAWDVADTERPACRRQRHVEPGHVPPAARQALAEERRTGPVERRVTRPSITLELPLELPADVAQEMAWAYRARDANPVAAMRAAFRVLLDRST